MTNFTVVVNQIIIMAILITIGFGSYKIKIISSEIKDGIAKLINKITMPCLILTSISNLQLTKSIFKDSIVVISLTYIALLILFLCGNLTSKLLRLKGITKNVHTTHIIFGNIVFLGFPLFQALYPNGNGIFYAMIFYLVSDSLLWTLGIYLLNKHKNTSKKSVFKHFINSNTIAFAVGIMMFIFGVKLPVILNDAFSGMGHITIYLAMLFIGSTLATIKIKGIHKKYSIFILTFIKMLVVPIILIISLNLISFVINISEVAKTVVIMQIAMPCMATVVVLAKEYKSDYIYSAECVFVSTIFSVFTLPFIFYLIQVI